MTYSALWFSQLQFFGSLSFMTIFFGMSLGLSWLLFYLRLRAIGEQQLLWLPMYRFWVRIFALAFLLGFASSMPVFIQLGSLWPTLFAKIHAVSSPLLAVALLGALVLKAGLLGLMLFAQRQLADWLHAAVVFLVALGYSGVAACLIALVSWMHTPTGVKWVDGNYEVSHWLQVIANPSLLWYGLLFITASFAMVACLMMAVLALRSVRRPLGEGERRVFQLAVYVGSVAWVGLLVAFIGNGHMVAEHQPIKAAAAMAYWQSDSVPSWLLIAWPSPADLSNHWSIGLNQRGQMWLGQDADGMLLGLDQVAGMSPPVLWVFIAVRVAMLAGLGMLALLTVGWRLGLTRHYDPSALTPRIKALMIYGGWLGPILWVAGLMYQLFGNLPFVVGQTITLNEIYAQHQLLPTVVSFIAYGLVYGLLTIGFIALVRSVARYGVVAVARHRGRA